MSAVRVILTRHAASQAAHRLDVPPDEVVSDVRRGIIEGRIDARRPLFLGTYGGGDDPDQRVRYVWNAAASRCYVVRLDRGAWIVLTSLGPSELGHGTPRVAQAFAEAERRRGAAA